MFLPAEAEDADAVEYGKDIKKRTPNIIFGVLFFISNFDLCLSRLYLHYFALNAAYKIYGNQGKDNKCT